MEGLFGGEGPQVQPVAVGEMHAFALACHQMISSPNPSITNVKVCGVAPTVAGRLPSRSPSLSNSRITARSEEHTSELQSLMRISYAVFCLKKKINTTNTTKHH